MNSNVDAYSKYVSKVEEDTTGNKGYLIYEYYIRVYTDEFRDKTTATLHKYTKLTDFTMALKNYVQ